MIHDTKNVGKPTVLTCRFPTFYGCLLQRALKAKEGSLEYAIARDQLIKRHVLPDDEIVESDDDYWGQFK